MKKVQLIFAVMFLFGMFLMLSSLAYGQWSALNSGYAVTTNYHGVEVPPGTSVTATAGTTDPNVEYVTIRWKYKETIVYEDANVKVWFNGTKWKGQLIYYANSSYTPEVLGDWCVQVLFIGKGGRTKANCDDVIKIRATSFNVIPELPVVGTAGAITVMLLGLGLFLRKRRNNTFSFVRR